MREGVKITLGRCFIEVSMGFGEGINSKRGRLG